MVKKAWNKLNTLNIGRNQLEIKAIDVLKSSSWRALPVSTFGATKYQKIK